MALRSAASIIDSALGQCRTDRTINAAEVRRRVRVLLRLFAAWPNARPANEDATLLEYLNATRGVSLEQLPRLVQAVIDAGGEFVPPASTLLERAAKHLSRMKQRTYNPVASIEEREEWERHDLLQSFRATQREVAPVLPADLRASARIGLGDERQIPAEAPR